jgi:hypothetical protein
MTATEGHARRCTDHISGLKQRPAPMAQRRTLIPYSSALVAQALRQNDQKNTKLLLR